MKLAKLFLAGALAVAAGAVCVCDSRNKTGLESRIVSTLPSTTKSIEHNLAYGTIKEVFIKDFLRDYLADVTPKTDNFQKLEKRYGKEGLLEEYASAHELCLDLAYENRGKKITEEMHAKLGNQLANKQQETSRGISPVNNLDKGVVEWYIKWGRAKTNLFARLLEAAEKENKGKDSEDYALRLIRGAYSREEYGKYAAEFCEITDGLYRAMKGTMGISGLFAGEQMNTIANCTRKAYMESIDDYFPDQKQKVRK